MPKPTPAIESARPRLFAWFTTILAVGALTLGFWLPMALSPEDTEALESPLALSVARQLVDGPFHLYGPYGGQNPLVLIHAPLYYHLAALAAWPIAHAGLHPVTAALVAGRSLSFLGLLVTMVAIYRLARLDEAPARVGWWAVLLFAATPIHGGLPFEVRPDLLGIAFQTVGVLLVCAAIRADGPRQTTIIAAFIAFGLAGSIKQLFVVAPSISALLLLVSWRNGAGSFTIIARAVVLAAMIVGIVYGIEELATNARMSQAIFGAAGNVGRIHPASWFRVYVISLAVIWKCVGWLAVLLAAGIAMLGRHAGLVRRFAAAVGTILVAVIVLLAFVQFLVVHNVVSTLISYGLLALVVLVVPAAIYFEREGWLGGKLDRVLWIYVAGELVMMIALFRISTGAWYNYAIQAVVFGCVLTARLLERALEGVPGRRPILAVMMAVLAVPAFAFTDARQIARKRFTDHVALEQISILIQRPPDEYFFVDRPGDNRVHGRLDLVYDAWLYPVFESMGLAEPRSVWLGRALESGPVHVVVMETAGERIDGIDKTLPELGYRYGTQVGSFHVWVRPHRVTGSGRVSLSLSYDN